MKRAWACGWVVIGLVAQTAWAGDRFAVLPVGGNGVDPATKETATLLLRTELERIGEYELVPPSGIAAIDGSADCLESACAVAMGKQCGADRAMYSSMNRLGEKIIFQYALVDVGSGNTVISDNVSVVYIEEFDQVAARVAESVSDEVPYSRTVEVGRVTTQEALDSPTRKANSSWGIGFGYLYPSHGYQDEKDIFVWDFRSIYELRNVAIDAVLGARKGFAMNVGVLYIPSRKDFSPYAGVGLGFHAVDHEYYGGYWEGDVYHDEELSEDGFEFLVKAGLLAFRTYDFRVVLTGEYAVVLNDFDDAGFVVTIGVMRSGKRVFGIF